MIGRVLAVAALAVVAWGGTAVLAVPASAHPLGNFSVNVYNGIVIASDEVVIDHVIDLAELPTVQAMPQLDANGDEIIAVAELDAFAQDRCGVAVGGLQLRVGDALVPLAVNAASATVADGQAGLSTLRIECTARGAVAVNGSEGVSFSDNSLTDEAGWHEVTLRGEGVTVSGADVPADSQSAALTAYPESLQSAPLRVTTASATVAAGGAAVGAPAGAASDGLSATSVAGDSKPWDWGADLLSGATSTATGPAGMSLAIVVALFVGALHALAPGHGKSLVAFALAGRQERAARAAATVGATVTITHTASVLALGLVVAGTATVIPRELYSILGGVTGLVVMVLGAVLLRNALRGGGGHGHSNGHSHSHSHGHDHGHRYWHGHGEGGSPGHQLGAQSSIALKEDTGRHTEQTHGHGEPASGLPQARRGVLVTLGVTGGLLPSPSAVVVLLASAASGRAWFGVVLVLAFGIGMACTLAGVGFAVLRGQGRLLALAERSPRPWLSSALRRLPIVTAAAVILIGTAVLVSSLS